jgi:uncharacterized protein
LTQLIDSLARALVDYPDRVEVSEIRGETACLIQLKVARGDVGKILGRNGLNANAIRTILNSAPSKMRRRAFLDILV